MKKTPVVIKGDLEALQAITDEEQLAAARISRLEKERHKVMKEIAGVLNTDVEALKLADMIRVLERRPVEKKIKVSVDLISEENIDKFSTKGWQ